MTGAQLAALVFEAAIKHGDKVIDAVVAVVEAIDRGDEPIITIKARPLDPAAVLAAERAARDTDVDELLDNGPRADVPSMVEASRGRG